MSNCVPWFYFLMCDFEKINVGQLGAVGQSFLHLDLTRVAKFSLASFED